MRNVWRILFFQTVRNEVRRIRVDASSDVLCPNGVVRLMHNLIDCTEVLVFKQESKLFFVARELKPESVVDCTSCFEDYPQF